MTDGFADAVDRLIHEPARLDIAAVLHAVDAADFMFIQRQTRLTKGNLGSHLGKLEAAGYVESEKRFVGKVPQTIYRLSARGREAIEEYRAHMGRVLEQLT